jgi:hypothetical protein
MQETKTANQLLFEMHGGKKSNTMTANRRPTKPAKPAKPTKPVKPAKPTKPAKPAKPANRMPNKKAKSKTKS